MLQLKKKSFDNEAKKLCVICKVGSVGLTSLEQQQQLKYGVADLNRPSNFFYSQNSAFLKMYKSSWAPTGKFMRR